MLKASRCILQPLQHPLTSILSVWCHNHTVLANPLRQSNLPKARFHIQTCIIIRPFQACQGPITVQHRVSIIFGAPVERTKVKNKAVLINDLPIWLQHHPVSANSWKCHGKTYGSKIPRCTSSTTSCCMKLKLDSEHL